MIQTIEKIFRNFTIISNVFFAEQLQQGGEENKGKMLNFQNNPKWIL